MDFYEAKSKLLYVSELLADIGHYHQTNLHACACDLCIQKKSLLRSSIAKALQEVNLVHQALEKGKHELNVYKIEGSPVSNLNFSCNLSSASGVPLDGEAVSGNKNNHSHLSPNNCARLRDHAGINGEQRNLAEQNGQADHTYHLLTPNNVDSGIHALSRSSSPTEAGSPPNENLDPKAILPKVSLDVDSSHQSLGRLQSALSPSAQASFNAKPSGPGSPGENSTEQKISKPLLESQISSNPFKNIDGANKDCKGCELNTDSEIHPWSYPSLYLPSISANNLPLSPNPWMGNLLPPFTLMSFLPTPSIVHELNRRYSEVFIQKSPQGNQDDQRNQTFSNYGHAHPTTLSFSPFPANTHSNFSAGIGVEKTPPVLIKGSAESNEVKNSRLDTNSIPFGTPRQDESPKVENKSKKLNEVNEERGKVLPNIDVLPERSQNQTVSAADNEAVDLKKSHLDKEIVQRERFLSSRKRSVLHSDLSAPSLTNAKSNTQNRHLTTDRLADNLSDLNLRKEEDLPYYCEEDPGCKDLKVDLAEKFDTEKSCAAGQNISSQCGDEKSDATTLPVMKLEQCESFISDISTNKKIDLSAEGVEENEASQCFSDSDSMVWRPWESKNDISKLVSLELDNETGMRLDNEERGRLPSLAVQKTANKSSQMIKDNGIESKNNQVLLCAQENKSEIMEKSETNFVSNFKSVHKDIEDGEDHVEEDCGSADGHAGNLSEEIKVLSREQRPNKRLEHGDSRFQLSDGDDNATSSSRNLLRSNNSLSHQKSGQVKIQADKEVTKSDNKLTVSSDNGWKNTENSLRKIEPNSETEMELNSEQNVQFTVAENEKKSTTELSASDAMDTSLKCVSNLETSNRKSQGLDPQRKSSLSNPLKQDAKIFSRTNRSVGEDKENETLPMSNLSARGTPGRTNFIITNPNVSSDFIITETRLNCQEKNQTTVCSPSGMSSSVPSVPSNKQMQWGAPAVMAYRCGLNTDDKLQTQTEFSEHNNEKNAHTDKTNSEMLGQGRPQVQSGGTSSKAESCECHDTGEKVLITADLVSTPVSSKRTSFLTADMKNKLDDITPVRKSDTITNPETNPWVVPKNLALIRDRNKLNHSLPLTCGAFKASHDQSGNTLQINESYEANQSFPKTTKPQQTEVGVAEIKHKTGFGGTVGGQNHVTDLHQIASPAQPRNRRSIFGFSPPDPHQIQKVKDSNQGNISHGDASLIESKSFSDPNDPGYMDTLWSELDASQDIGHSPTIQEVLFNCVTSSICVVDPSRNGKIISVNESFQFLIGFHEKVVGQRLFRFIKIKNSLEDLGVALPQSFVLSDGRVVSISGKLVSCIDARGEEKYVTIWTVPYSPQPKLTLCVIGVSAPLEAEIYLNRDSKVLMYQELFEDIVGLVENKHRDSAEGVCQISGLDFDQINVPKHTFIRAMDGCLVPATVTLSDIQDTSQMKDNHGDEDKSMSPIYPATLSVAANVSGLMTVQSDGLIKSCDQNFFRINLGYSTLARKHYLSEFLSEVMKISQRSSPSSENSSPSDRDGKNSGTFMGLGNISRLGDDDMAGNYSMQEKDSESDSQSLFLLSACFSKQVTLGLDDDDDNDESNEGNETDESIDTDSEVEELEEMAIPSERLPLAPHQTSTPCKRDWGHGLISKGCKAIRAKEEKTTMENGIYAALFLHRNGNEIPVTFKLSRIRPLGKDPLYCLWFYIQPDNHDDENDDEDTGESEEDDEAEEEDADGEEDLRRRLRHLNFDKSLDNTVEPSLGQLILDQAALNQSQNAASSDDVLDLETAVAGKFSREYVVHETLGQGSFGFVRRATVIGSDKSVVVKFIKKSKMFEDSWVADTKKEGKIPLEVAVLRETDSEFIIKLLDVYENEGFVQMVMEDFGDVDLFDFIDQVDIDEPLACFLFRQILWAVEYLHSVGIIHRDIKDENVIINSNFSCKLIDFGSAAYLPPKGKFFTAFRGTTEYCSPEVYDGQSYRGPELDIWALGVTLYTLVFRENPFTVTDMPEAFSHLEFPQAVSEDLVELISGLLETNPTSRLKMSQALTSDWLRQIVDMSNYNWEDMMGDPQKQVENIDVDIIGRGSGYTYSE